MNKYNLDLHIVQQACNPIWTKQCYETIEQTPANIHILDQGDRILCDNRLLGYQRGSAEYLCSVDNDDWIYPEVIPHCIKILDENPHICGVYTGEKHINSDGNTILDFLDKGVWHPRLMIEPRIVHNITIMRRDVVEKCLHVMSDYPWMPEFVLKAKMLQYGTFKHLPMLGYAWRIHNQGTHILKAPDDFFKAIWFAVEQVQQLESKAHI